ncbi:MAG: hypothetical protein GY925_05870 [Actinomycetia bacterium]|nr:hypothetical protein [Actinomycetes bacterium]
MADRWDTTVIATGEETQFYSVGGTATSTSDSTRTDIATSPPVEPGWNDGDQWVDMSAGKIYTWDAASSSWDETGSFLTSTDHPLRLVWSVEGTGGVTTGYNVWRATTDLTLTRFELFHPAAAPSGATQAAAGVATIEWVVNGTVEQTITWNFATDGTHLEVTPTQTSIADGDEVFFRVTALTGKTAGEQWEWPSFVAHAVARPPTATGAHPVTAVWEVEGIGGVTTGYNVWRVDVDTILETFELFHPAVAPSGATQAAAGVATIEWVVDGTVSRTLTWNFATDGTHLEIDANSEALTDGAEAFFRVTALTGKTAGEQWEWPSFVAHGREA